MAGPHPSTAAIRTAVRSCLAEVEAGSLVLAACSGGADSLALAEALAFVAAREPCRAGAVVVDHGLQPGSASVAATAAATCRALGLDPVIVRGVRVARTGRGVEADARAARYEALGAVADETGATLVLLGHTLDDQAEQVLLGLVRGSGARSLAGMPPSRGRFRRPLLGVTREQTRASCTSEGIGWWEDPMNEDTAFLRVRVRRALRDLEADLGPGIPAALARTADLLREDADHLDTLAGVEAARLLAAETGTAGQPIELAVQDLLVLPRAIRTRVWRRLLVAMGAPAGQVSTRHTDACEALLTDWHGQGPAHLPGHVQLNRTGAVLILRRGHPRV